MRILMLGLSVATAALDLRSQAAISASQLPQALVRLIEHPAILEGSILSTCNRTEVYAVATDAEPGFEALEAFLIPTDPAGLKPHLVRLEQEAAATHLFRVAAGLESQILGEGQILSQVKEAHGVAQTLRSSGTILDTLFRYAIAAGKRTRNETAISRGAVSVSGAALEFAKQLMGSLRDRRTLILGTGQIGELAARQLVSMDAGPVYITNRTLESAQSLAGAIGCEAIAFHDLSQVLRTVDIVLCCTGAPHHVLSAADIAEIVRDRSGRDLLLIDVSVPRNLDPAIGGLPGVRLCDLDHLEAIAEGNRSERANLIPQVEAILVQELEGFWSWLRNYQLMPTMAGLRDKLHETCERELDKFWKHHAGHFSEPQQHLVAAALEGILDKLMHSPMTRLKQMNAPQQQQLASMLKTLFDLSVENLEDHHRRRLTERRDAIKWA